MVGDQQDHILDHLLLLCLCTVPNLVLWKPMITSSVLCTNVYPQRLLQTMIFWSSVSSHAPAIGSGDHGEASLVGQNASNIYLFKTLVD